MEKVAENPMKLPDKRLCLKKMNWDRKKEKVNRKIRSHKCYIEKRIKYLEVRGREWGTKKSSEYLIAQHVNFQHTCFHTLSLR